jgi:HAMP domain-containing protein
MILAMTSIVVVGGALVLTLRLVGSIQALRAGAARIGSGDLASRISIKTGDELEALARSACRSVQPDGGIRSFALELRSVPHRLLPIFGGWFRWKRLAGHWIKGAGFLVG